MLGVQSDSLVSVCVMHLAMCFDLQALKACAHSVLGGSDGGITHYTIWHALIKVSLCLYFCLVQ